MTARGGRQHRWTSAQYAYVLENAGRVPAREIRRELKVSKSQLDHACQRMRANGCPVSLRCYEPRLSVCPHCGRPSATLWEHGVCEPCRLERRLSEARAEAAEMLPLLGAEARATYEASDAKVESAPPPRPPAPCLDGLDRYSAAKAQEEWDAAMERWRVTWLKRQLRAAMRRKQRIAKKLRTQQISGYSDEGSR